jgi:galactokinase
MSGRDKGEVRVVVAPYRICPLGAHIDHQGGTVSAMTINKGILLGFVPSGDTQVCISYHDSYVFWYTSAFLISELVNQIHMFDMLGFLRK